MAEVIGPELLTNGDFSASAGQGAGSVAGPGWATAYAACGPSLFAAPCGAQNWAFFTTNAGQVTGNNPAATPLAALGGRSFAVNVGPNTNVPIIEWASIHLINGQKYRLQATAGIIFGPFAVAIRIAGGAQGNFPVTSPTVASQWQTTITDFTFTGPTGNYPVGLYSNSGVAGGNDHAFDNISLRTVTEINSEPPCGCCPTGLERCWAQQNPLSCNNPSQVTPPTFSTPSSAAVVENPNGYTFAGPIARTHDGLIQNDTGNWHINTSGSPQTAVGVVVRWSYNADLNDVVSFSIWHGAGGILSDCDGVVSATITVRDAALNVLFTGPITTANSGAQHITVFPALLQGVRHFELSNISRCSGSVNIWIREVRLNTRWESDLTYTCPPLTMTGHIEAVNPTTAAGITVGATTLNQTNGPHTITWDLPPGVTGVISTNNPGNFSDLAIADGTVTTITGNANNQFSIAWTVDDLSDIAEPAHGMLCGNQVIWFDGDGNQIPVELLVDCP